MPYRSDLEARLARKVTRAVTEYELIEDGDRILIGLSGGKDSWALIQILDVLRVRAPIRFSLDTRLNPPAALRARAAGVVTMRS